MITQKSSPKKILITGNMGYVGSTLVSSLREKYPGIEIYGYDTGFFATCITENSLLPEINLNKQYFGDVRNFPKEILFGIDTVIHLAAISNDPMGKEFEEITSQINYKSTIQIAEYAKLAGVKNFVFASSCSVYGYASEYAKKETDELNPLTAYATSKIDSEIGLKKLATDTFIITCLRFATACGWSDRLRLDLVLNDFVTSALLLGEISILSDGSPLRPLIDVKDMSRAIDWASKREADNGGNFLIINIGSNNANYSIYDIAISVKKILTNTTVSINKDAAPDKRSYKVSFDLFNELAPNYTPLINIDESILNLVGGLKNMNFNDKYFRESNLIRLFKLNNLKSNNKINNNLYYIKNSKK